MRFVPPHEVSLIAHARQPERYGCLPCAMYAVTGDHRFLDRMNEVHPWRMYAHATTLGYATLPVWNTLEQRATTHAEWDRMLEGLTEEFVFLHLVTITSPTHLGLNHTVGVAATVDAHGEIVFTVSDSQREALIQGDRGWFYDSLYSQALSIEVVLPADRLLEDIPWEPPEVLQARDLARLEARREVLQPAQP